MFYNELTTQEKRRFLVNDICPICHKRILKEDRCILVIDKISRSKRYTFYHEECYNGNISQ